MKKGTKIALIVLGVIVGIGVVLFVGADLMLSRFVQREVNKALTTLPAGEASCGSISIRLFSGTAGVSDIRFTYHGQPVNRRDTIGPGVDIYVKHIEVGRLFYSMLFDKQALVSDLHISEPRVELWMDEEHPELCFPEFPKDTAAEPFEFPLKRAELMHFHLHDASFALHSLRTKLDVAAEGLTLHVNHLAYDSTFSYCDSVYRLALDHAAIMFPDGMMRMETRDLRHRDQGEVTIGETRICNTMPRNKLGDIVKEPVTWMDMTIGSVTIAPLNPIRKALAQDITISNINAVVDFMDVYRDARYEPKHPFPTPQEILLKLPITFTVKHIDSQIKRIDIAFASTDKNIGKLQLGDIKARVDNVSNRRGTKMVVNGGCPIEKGDAKAYMSMTMNKTSDFELKMQVVGADAGFMNGFVRPLVGISCELPIDTLRAEYRGDNVKATGTFCLQYHGLKIQVHQEDDIPYKIITKNAKLFTALGNSLVPKSNPTSVDIRPRAYEVEWPRDASKPYPLYMFGPCIDGIKKTFLPGLYVHKEVKEKKAKKSK